MELPHASDGCRPRTHGTSREREDSNFRPPSAKLGNSSSFKLLPSLAKRVNGHNDVFNADLSPWGPKISASQAFPSGGERSIQFRVRPPRLS